MKTVRAVEAFDIFSTDIDGSVSSAWTDDMDEVYYIVARELLKGAHVSIKPILVSSKDWKAAPDLPFGTLVKLK